MSAVQVQLALDTLTTAEALAAATAAAASVDVIEAGTVLCLSEGLHAVRALRAEFPHAPIVADIRIARAGGKFADLAFSAGASRVTVVGESGMTVISGALASAQSHGGEVEVELGENWTEDEVQQWVDSGVSHIIAHRSGRFRAEDDGEIRTTLERLESVDRGNARVTLAGGLALGDLAYFPRGNFDVVAVGSTIVKADDPRAAAQSLRTELQQAERSSQWQPTT
ncbi:orotidine 5'-phosphate decarboxylase / HUMPS family protein [Paramicrobacterium fandaimingii]|uniref:orotidine 5'-phosphate decarboxylase / HUMPS family protein n=1 Tax=Paramicrobacterium fandaimingii TaxID=2708079 RepID=UPI0014217632|nr:orotidine 5'-phosphate decarboxylase / HUMPS family protein [Microbacterium fandaimingii]